MNDALAKHIREQINKLQSPKADIRYEACEYLRVASELTPEAIKALQDALKDSDSEVVNAAKSALQIHLSSKGIPQESNEVDKSKELEKPKTQSVTVKLMRINWETIISIFEPIYNSNGSEWMIWGKNIKQTIQIGFGQKNAQDVIPVTFPISSWDTICRVISNNCKNKDKDWLSWANSIVQTINQTIADAPVESPKEQTSYKNADDNSSTSNDKNEYDKSNESKKREGKKQESRNYYDILGVETSASAEVIKERFRFLSQAYHPDKFANASQKLQAEEEFKVFNEAYQTLSDPENRSRYDERILGKESQTKRNNDANPTEPTAYKQSKTDEYYYKGRQSFFDALSEPDIGKRTGLYSKANGYLAMAYKEAGNNIEEKKGIAGLTSLVLAYMDDCKNAETWANAEISINPTNVYAKLARYHIELDKLIGHKGFVLPSDGSGAGIVASLLTVGVDAGRVQSKKNNVRIAAIEAAKIIEMHAKTDSDPDPSSWLIWAYLLLSIIDNMWGNKMKEPYLCNVLLTLPWNRFRNDQIKDIQENIEELQIQAHGYLGRLK